MSNETIGAIATILGAAMTLAGSVIGIYLVDRLKQRNQEIALYESLVHAYMLQLQHVITSLWYRLENISHPGRGGVFKEGESVNSYYMISTLYAFGCVLAYNRIMLLEGVYAKLQDKGKTVYGRWLKKQLTESDKKSQVSGYWLKGELKNIDDKLEYLNVPSFVRYERIALADALIRRAHDGHLLISTYSEFYTEYSDENSFMKMLLDPAINFIRLLAKHRKPEVNEVELTQLEKLMEELRCLSAELNERMKNRSESELRDKCPRCKKLTVLRGNRPCIT